VLLILLAFLHVSVAFVMVIVVVKLGALHFDVAAGLGGGAGTRFHCPSLDQKLLVLHAADVCSWHRVRCSLLHA